MSQYIYDSLLGTLISAYFCFSTRIVIGVMILLTLILWGVAVAVIISRGFCEIDLGIRGGGQAIVTLMSALACENRHKSTKTTLFV